MSIDIAIIPAKGKSRRIPNKNIRPFHGVPIISYVIQLAQEAERFAHVYVSTDDDEVAKTALFYGAEVLHRDKKWAREKYGPLDVARHHLETMPDVHLCCIIYATAVMLTPELIREACRLARINRTAYCLTVGATPFLHDAGQLICCKKWALEDRIPEFGVQTILLPVKPERDCDINTLKDWQRAETMYAKLKRWPT